MDYSAQYCSTRKAIEERCWNLTSRLSASTAKLMKAVGRDPGLFLVTRSECQHTREELADSRDRLTTHRSAHGC